MQMSVWEKESFYAPSDAIIIGAGLAGLWCAYELKKNNPGSKILVLEKGIVPCGASTRNAGFACFGSPTELLHDAAMMGDDQMLAIAEMRYKGIEKIRKVLGDEAIGFDGCGGFECLNNGLHDIKKLKDDLGELNKKLTQITSLDETFTWSNSKLKNFGLNGFDAMIENSLEGSLHSGRLVNALTKKVRAMDVDILTGIDVLRFEEKNNSVTVYTKQNIVFNTERLLICTNAFSNDLFPELNIIPGRGQVIVTNEIGDLQLRGTFHYDAGFYYFRNLGKRVLLGGARNIAFDEEETTDLSVSEKVQQELERFLSTHILPSQKHSVDHCWSGIMGFTKDKQPLIKNISSRVTAIIACNGMGVALTPIIAEKIKMLLQ